MATFEYQVRDRQGVLEAGTIEASSKDSVLDILQRRGYTVLSVAEKKKNAFSFSLFGRATAKDVVILSRQLATLFEAQVPIIESLRTLAEETSKPVLKDALGQILADVTGGLALSQAFAKHPKFFSAFYVNLIRSGEESGKLQEVFLYLADYVERSYYLTMKARNAMIYPAFILVAFVAVIILMLTVVIPGLLEIFEETGQELPIYTKALLYLSTFLRHYGIFLGLFLVLAAIFLVRWKRTPDGAMFFARVQIHIPLVPDLYKKLFIARLAENLQILISSGIPILRAIEITRDVVGNLVFAHALEEAYKAVRGGGTISSAFKSTPEIPTLV
ncbi:MAG: type II secretion system F family protein, partial [Patescibacteria group bacterium]